MHMCPHTHTPLIRYSLSHSGFYLLVQNLWHIDSWTVECEIITLSQNFGC